MSWLILRTDILVYVLFAATLAFIVHVVRTPLLAQRWRGVFASRTGLNSTIILCVFAAIALLDSVHLRVENTSMQAQRGEIISVLDLALSDLRLHGEETYSAPLAIFSFSKTTIENDSGEVLRTYPRLRFGGQHLTDPSLHAQDTALRALYGALLGLLTTFALILLVVALASGLRPQSCLANVKLILGGKTQLPWRSGLLTSLVLGSIIGLLLYLSRYYHVMGTDMIGNDVLYQGIKSIRTGVLIGTLTTLIMLPMAILLGIAAGYFKGWIDDVIQYLYTTLNSIPGVLLIAAAILMSQVYMASHPDLFQSNAERSDLRLLFLCLILGLTSWTGLCRLLRAETLKVAELEFVQAAKAFGASHWHIIHRHILPNVMHIVLISVVIDFSSLVLAEAVLSYVGVGVDSDMPSWGNMINRARMELAREPAVWWSLAAAFALMFTLVLAANLLADRIRDTFDPRNQGGQHD